MTNKFSDIASQWGNKAREALSNTSSKAAALVQQHKPDAQEIEQAKLWAQRTAAATAEEIARLSREVRESPLGRVAAKGAASGTVTSLPVPIIGPALSAVVGASASVYAHLTRSKTSEAPELAPEPVPSPYAPVVEVVAPDTEIYARLLHLDDLLKKGILTQAEFDAQKKKVLGGA
jgi:hypothetical protein